MRKIKFRAWDKFRNKMIDNILSIKLNRISGEPHLVIYTENKINPSVEIKESDKSYCNEFDLIEYTGLKDKNGTEIYEGDILHHYSIKKKDLYQVKWDENNASFHITQGVGGFAMFTTSEGFFPYVVVGNIYENPELLEEKQ